MWARLAHIVRPATALTTKDGSKEERVDSQDYRVDIPPSREGFPNVSQEMGFNVKLLHPLTRQSKQFAGAGQPAPRSGLIRDLREAGVSMPDFIDGPVEKNFDIYAQTNLLKRPGIAGDATQQEGRKAARHARPTSPAFVRRTAFNRYSPARVSTR